jgi:phage terminase small subunit
MTEPGKKPLQNARHEKFAREYSRHGRKERAVVAAGFEAKNWLDDGSTSAAVRANSLLKNTKILERIQYLQEARSRNADITEMRVIQELKRIAFFDSRKLRGDDGELKDPKDWDAETGAAISGMEIEKLFQPGEDGRKAHVGYTVKVKTHDKLKAIENLMRYFGMVEPASESNPVTINNDNRQVHFYLPENTRHAQKHEHAQEATVTAQPNGHDLIQLPAKPTNGSH